jgi:hypothetical protein
VATTPDPALDALTAALLDAGITDTSVTREPHGKVHVRMPPPDAATLTERLGIDPHDLLPMALPPLGVPVAQGAVMPEHTSLYLTTLGARHLTVLLRPADGPA